MLDLDVHGEAISAGQTKMPCPGYYIDLTGKLIYVDSQGNDLPNQE